METNSIKNKGLHVFIDHVNPLTALTKKVKFTAALSQAQVYILSRAALLFRVGFTNTHANGAVWQGEEVFRVCFAPDKKNGANRTACHRD